MAAIPHQLLANQLDLLHSILPPDTIIHAGAGHGAGCAQQWLKWQPLHAVIIDADAARLNWARQELQSHPGWGLSEAVLGGEEGEADYHVASNRNEDGLLSPESLTALWPNLRTIETVKKSVRRLDTLLHTDYQEVLDDSRCIWAIIESLPGLSVLQGAGQELDRWSVVWVRVLLSAAPQPELDDATLAAVEAYLRQHGFNCALVVEGNHPAVGEAIFVRDWRHVLTSQLTEQKTHFDQAVKTKDEQTKLSNDRQAKIEELTKARDEQANLAAERQAQLEQRTQERDEASKALAERQVQLDQAVKTKDEQTKLAIDRLTAIQKLTQERDEAFKDLAEQQAQLDQAVQAQAQQSKLAAERQGQIEQLSKARDEQVKIASERQTQLDQAIQTRDEQKKLADNRYSTIQKLTQEQDEAIKAKDERQAQLDQTLQAQEQQAKLAADRQVQISQLTQARDEQTNIASERQTQLEQQSKERDEQSKLATERQAALQKVTQERDEATKALAEQQAHIDQAVQAKDEQAKLAAERQAQISQLTQARDEQAILAAERQTQLEQRIKERDQQAKVAAERQEGIVQLKGELQQAHQTVNLTTKLHMLRESDLGELQQRYRESLATQERQHQLLAKLEERLRVASQYFNHLREQQLLLEGQQVVALPKPRNTTRRSEKKTGKK